MSLVSQIEAGIEQGKVKAHLVRKALSDGDINTRGLGYSMISEDHLRALLVEYKPKAGDAAACFEYLVECVKADLDWDEAYALTREDALFELASSLPLKKASKTPDMTVGDFWDEVCADLRTAQAEGAADYLESCDKDEAFEQALTEWREAAR